MSLMMQQPPMYPVYELDSVTDDKLDALILQLGLKSHNKDSLDPCCVICRQHALMRNQMALLRQRPMMVNKYAVMSPQQIMR